MTGEQCLTCTHYAIDGTCPYFTEGIPSEVLSGVIVHPEYRHYKTGKPAEDLVDE